jgi:hypothetical protein
VKLAGVGSVFPALSVARTWKVWEPGNSPVYEAGLEQAVKPPPSSSHSKVEPPSEELKSKLTSGVLGSGGATSIVVWGAVVSIVQLWVAFGPLLPAASV